MRVLEAAGIFQAEPEHPVESDVGDPDKRPQQWQMLAVPESVAA